MSLYPSVVIDEIFPGDVSLEKLKNELGSDYQIIQLEISRRYRDKHQKETIKALSNTLKILSSNI